MLSMARREETSLDLQYRNVLLKQEEIIIVMTQLLQEQGIALESEEDIRSGVDIYLMETMGHEPKYISRKLNRMKKSLSVGRPNSPFSLSILQEIEDLKGPPR